MLTTMKISRDNNKGGLLDKYLVAYLPLYVGITLGSICTILFLGIP